MTKAIILSRVSTQAQDLDQQTQVIVNEAIKEGFTMSDLIVIEDKESAIKLSEEERRGLNRMKQAIIEDPTITHVFIYELSRLSRRQLVLFSIRDFLLKRNIQLICCTPYFRMLEDGKLSQTANLMFSIFSSLAESEMELKKERMMRGRKHNAANGRNSGHKLILGYAELEDKTIIVDEEQAAIVKKIFEMYASGLYSLERLCAKCSKMFVVDDPKQFTKQRMRWLLTNENYCGSTEYPAIINRKLFDDCREAAKKNTSSAKHTYEDKAILKRIIFDDKGRHLTYVRSNFVERYINVEHGSPSMNREQIDDAVWNLTKMLHKNYVENKEIIRERLLKERDELIKARMGMMRKKVTAAQRIDAIEERLIYGSISKEKAEQLEEKVKQEIRTHETTISEIDEKMRKTDILIEQCDRADTLDYDTFDTAQKISLVRQTIEKIIISKPDRNHARAEVTPKVGTFTYIFEMDVYRKTTTMTSKMQK